MPTISGGSGDDSIFGTQAGDQIDGGAGNDVIIDDWGDDIIDGGDGDDTIIDRGGSNTINGGDGDDRITISDGTRPSSTIGDQVRDNVINAGAGRDFVTLGLLAFGGLARGSLALDLGDGDDVLLIDSPLFMVDHSIALGSGSDEVVLTFNYGDSPTALTTILTISDFTSGNDGDVLNLGDMLRGATSSPGSVIIPAFDGVNPFANGVLLLVQDGADTLVQFDYDGDKKDDSTVYTLIRLEGVTASSLTAENFAGFDPQSGASPAQTFTGTAGDDLIIGGSSLNQIDGAGGDDEIIGGFRADIIDGGAGNDRIDGGGGGDTIRGGEGDDFIIDNWGSDTLEGGDGNDTIHVVRPGLPEADGPLHEIVNVSGGAGNDSLLIQLDRRPFTPFETRSLEVIADLGDGDDTVRIRANNRAVLLENTLTLGAGRDSVFPEERFETAITITDFEAGDNGDILHLALAIVRSNSSGWDVLSNPFTGGFLRLEQSGTSTLVINDLDGSGGSSGPEVTQTLFVLENVDASTLTAANFNGYDPSGAASSYNVVAATSGDDVIYDSFADDVINGGAGDDYIEANLGGSDTLRGGEGNDHIVLRDRFGFEASDYLIEGGDGNDLVEFTASEGHFDPHSLTVDLGTGDDRFILNSAPERGSFLTLGTGRDTVVLDVGLSSQSLGLITITDFETGSNGDRFDWNFFAESEFFNGEPNFNPFTEGLARLVQSGDDSVLEIRLSVNSDFEVLAVFEDTNIGDFTVSNIGYFTGVPTAIGTDGDDTLNGNEEIDVIFGGAGNDIINGFAGADFLYGELGDDTISGGDDDDRIIGGGGNDTINGDAGDDYITAGNGTSTIFGGIGNDRIDGITGNDFVSGGEGDDTISLRVGFTNNVIYAGTIEAGAGNDIVTIEEAHYLYRNTPSFTVDLGAGDDLLTTDGRIPFVTLGAGQDRIVVEEGPRDGTMVITDFETGANGDSIDILGFLYRNLDYYFFVNSSGRNPFAAGLFRLEQNGDDVELYLVPDVSGAFLDELVVVFENTNVDDFTAENFDGFDPTVEFVTPVFVTQSITIAEGETLERGNIILDPSNAAHFSISGGGALDFVNDGTIRTFIDEFGYGVAVGVLVNNNSSFDAGSGFHNTATGEFFVRQDAESPLGPESSSTTAIGFRAGSAAFDFRNDGLFVVTATHGFAEGVIAGFRDFLGGASSDFVNTGTINVLSAYGAIGVTLGPRATFENSGDIVVNGTEFAIAFEWSQFNNLSTFNNSGNIVARVDPGSSNFSLGLVLIESFDRQGGSPFRVITNSGLISADIAVLVGDTTDPFQYPESIENTGVIEGALLLGNGDDRVLNAGGEIYGQVFLENGDDLFDGIGGFQIGGVYGGFGNDTYRIDDADIELIEEAGQGIDTVESLVTFTLATHFENLALLGSADLDGTGNLVANILTGNAGSNRLVGLGGNDQLLGGAGADVMIGGTGNDTYEIDNVGDEVVELAGEGFDIVNASITYTLLDHFERLVLVDGADIDGTGNALDNQIFGNAGSNTLRGGEGNDQIDGRDGVDVLIGGAGNDDIQGGSNVDTVILSGNFADYTIFQLPEEAFGFVGAFEVSGPDGSDFLVDVEYIQFDDQTIRLLRGTGVSVNFETADPSVYQSALEGLRDFDGNNLGGDGSWLRIGSADVNGDGDIDQILVNDAIGRFATVGTAPDGLVYFDDHSWAGETRIAGIYIDPLVESGDVVQGSDQDSQRRFQNDLQIENINRVLGSDDYDGDGIWEVYFALTDGTAYLRALMHEDGNIRYANYQSEQEVIDYLSANGYDEDTFGDWFDNAENAENTEDEAIFVNREEKAPDIVELPAPLHAGPVDEWVPEYT